jgi:hypothetical protein
MKKVLFVLMALLVVGTAGAQVWTHNAPANYKLELPKNQYGPGYQGTIQVRWLFDGQQVKAGEKYELEVTFKANRAVSKLQAVMVDGTEKASWWKELSEWFEFEDIAANTDVTKTITWTTIAGSTDNSLRGNFIAFDTEEGRTAVTLTFSKFTLKRIQ